MYRHLNPCIGGAHLQQFSQTKVYPIIHLQMITYLYIVYSSMVREQEDYTLKDCVWAI